MCAPTWRRHPEAFCSISRRCALGALSTVRSRRRGSRVVPCFAGVHPGVLWAPAAGAAWRFGRGTRRGRPVAASRARSRREVATRREGFGVDVLAECSTIPAFEPMIATPAVGSLRSLIV